MDRRIVAGQRPKKCQECGGLMVFARTQTGKVMPVDVDQHDDGNVFVHRDVHGVLSARVLGSENPTPRGYEIVTKHHRAVCTGQQTLPLPDNVVPMRRRNG